MATTDLNFFALNAQFNDFQSFLECKQAYEKSSNTILVVVDAHKLHGPNELNATFVYDRLILGCKAGKERPCQSTGIRKSATYKKNCPAKVRIAFGNNRLVVREVNLVHVNHAVDLATFDHYPENVRLTNDETLLAEKMVSVGANKKLVKSDLMKAKDGKAVLMKSLHNIQSKLNAHKVSGAGNELQQLYTALTAVPGATVRFITNEQNEILGIYFQDDRMSHLYSKYPEVILYDATYKLNKVQMPLFTQLCIDGNGETEIVSLYICRSESREGIQPMLETFKEFNPIWPHTYVIIGDKDFADRAVYSEYFPNAFLQICLYHVSLAFNREITTTKRNITATERITVLETLCKLLYSRTSEYYDAIYQELCDLNLDEVLRYYNTNWHAIKDEWTLHGRNKHANYMNSTNNRSERLNRTIKQIGNRYENLQIFFDNVITSVSVLASEKDIRAVRGTMRVERRRFENDVLTRYNDFLTPFIFKKIEHEFEMCHIVEFVVEGDDVRTVTGHSVTHESCSCMFFVLMKLPCKHILQLLTLRNLDPFVPTLCAARWTKPYYYQSHPALTAYEEIKVPQPVSIRRIRVPDEIDKYRKVAKVTKEINNLASTMSTGQYTLYMDKIEQLKNDMLGPQSTVTNNIQSTSVDHNSEAGPSSHINYEIPNRQNDFESLATATVPNKIVSIGRPKGSGKTVIGTKRKVTGQAHTQVCNKKRKFTALSEREQGLAVVCWLTNMSTVEISGKKKKISLDDVIQDTNIFNRLRNDHIDLHCVKKLVDSKCFKYLEKEAERLQETTRWPCSKCKKNLSGLQVMCCACLDWFHVWCTDCSTTSQTDDADYYCSDCR